LNDWALVSAVAADFLNEGKACGEFVKDQGRTITVLNACRMNLGLEDHA
jgi:hypothetical protein